MSHNRMPTKLQTASFLTAIIQKDKKSNPIKASGICSIPDETGARWRKAIMHNKMDRVPTPPANHREKNNVTADEESQVRYVALNSRDRK